MGLVTQLQTVQTGQDILTRSTRAATQFGNSASSLLVELGSFESTLPASGLDQDTLNEIAALKASTISSIQTQLAQIQSALDSA